MLVSDGHATHIEAAAVGQVEAPDEQAVLRDVEREQPVAGMGDGAIALEQRLRIPGLEPARAAGHALGQGPHGQDAVVGGVEVGALEAQLVVSLHAGIVAARAVGSKRRRRRIIEAASASLPSHQRGVC